MLPCRCWHSQRCLTQHLSTQLSAIQSTSGYLSGALASPNYQLRSQFSDKRHSQLTTLTAASARGRQQLPPKSLVPTAAAPSRVLFIGGLPARIAAEELQQQLLTLCHAAGCQPTRVQVLPFDDDAQRSRFAEGWLHKGFGLIAFQNEASVEAVAAAIRANAPGWGSTATLGPARKLPADWLPHHTYTPEELEDLQQRQAALELRRAHNRRQRLRQSQRLVDSVDTVLSSLQPPFGAAAQGLYQPLLSQQAVQQLLAVQDAAGGSADAAAGSGSLMPPRLQACLRWPALLPLLHQQDHHQQQDDRQQQQQQHQQLAAGPIQLVSAAAASTVADVERQLLFDWSQIPGVLDPAFGGRLADADVVRAGKGRMNLRALRKRVQVESFALLLWQLLTQQHHPQPQQCSTSSRPATLHVVEFGSGSGNLILPLAHLFPDLSFTAVDMKPSAVQLLQERVQQAGLANVTAVLGRIEEYQGPLDVALGLHACGSATDWALEQAAAHQAAFIVSPCCIGKINRHSSSSSSGSSIGSGGEEDGMVASGPLQHHHHQQQQRQPHQRLRFPGANGLQYPRSQQLQQQMRGLALSVWQEVQQLAQQQQQGGGGDLVLNKLQEAVLSSYGGSNSSSGSLQAQPDSDSSAAATQSLFSILAATADYSHQDKHSHPQLAGLAKTNVELDRGVHMREAGYDVRLVRLLQPELTAKSDVLVGQVCRAGGS